MERKLLLLGLLRSHEMHGYQLHEFVDTHLGASIHLKKPTTYNLLNKMADDGWITYRVEQEGNRPPRRVYGITPQGETAFQRLLRDSLADYKPAEFPGEIGLLFLDAIPGQEALSLLQKRRAIVESMLRTLHSHGEHPEGFQLMLLYQTRHLSAELEWLDEVIALLESRSQDHSPGEGRTDQGHG